MKKITVVISGLLLQILLSGTTVYADPADPWIATKNTTRVNSSNPTEAAAITSRTVWPATMKENRPGGIILTDPTNRAVALVSLKLVHHPISGPVLFVDKNRIPVITLKEIKRLRPLGVPEYQNVQLFLVGDISDGVKGELESLGYKTERVYAGNEAAKAAETIDDFATKISGEIPKNVIVGSMDDLSFTAPAGNWIAHMPEPLLYVRQNEIPTSTQTALMKRNGQAVIYILGPESVVSDEVVQKLREYGKVKRISGEDPISNSIAFAMYIDPETGFGWGIQQPGHTLSFVPTGNIPLVIAAGPFTHMGKHSPIIWTQSNQLASPIKQYLTMLQPMYKKTPTEGPYDHAWITGSLKDIPYNVQGEIDQRIEIVPASGMGHGSPMGH